MPPMLLLGSRSTGSSWNNGRYVWRWEPERVASGRTRGRSVAPTAPCRRSRDEGARARRASTEPPAATKRRRPFPDACKRYGCCVVTNLGKQPAPTLEDAAVLHRDLSPLRASRLHRTAVGERAHSLCPRPSQPWVETLRRACRNTFREAIPVVIALLTRRIAPVAGGPHLEIHRRAMRLQPGRAQGARPSAGRATGGSKGCPRSIMTRTRAAVAAVEQVGRDCARAARRAAAGRGRRASCRRPAH